MNVVRKIAFNTLTQIIGKIASTILGLLAISLITRYLGIDGFGKYTTILTFLTFFAVLADFGLTLVTVQMLSDPTADEKKVINNLFGLRLASIIVVMAIAPLVISLLPYEPVIKWGALIACLSFLFPALNQVIIGLLQKKLSMDKSALAETGSRLALIISILLVKYLNGGLNGILWASVISAATSFILHYIFAQKFTRIKPEFDRLLWRRIIHKSWPLAVTIVLNLIYLRADILILSWFKSAGEVGLYGAAYKIIDVLTAIPFMFAGLILPIISSAWLENKKDYFDKALQKSYDFMAICAIPLIIGTQFVARPLIILIAGEAFTDAEIILRILILAIGAIFLGSIFSHAIIALDKQKTMITYYLLTSLSSLIAYLILIPRFSYFGAAAVTVYSEVLIAIFSLVFTFKYGRFRPSQKILFKATLSSLVMAVFLYFFPLTKSEHAGHLALTVMLAATIYFLALFGLRAIKIKEVSALLKNNDHGSIPTYGGSGV